MYREQDYNRTAMVNSANAVIGSVQNARDDVSDYFQLRRLNDSLLKENARLRKELPNAWFLDTAQFRTISDQPDSLGHLRKQHYKFIAADVINNSVYKLDNYITLRVGSNHGVRRGMGVMGPNGIAGIVRDVGRNMAVAFSMLHRDISVPAQLKRTKDQGRVLWKGTDPEFAFLVDIGQHVQVERGDTVATSGFSTAFPANALIGVVDRYTINSGTGFLEIRLRLATDFRTLESAYIVDNLLGVEQLDLQSGNQ